MSALAVHFAFQFRSMLRSPAQMLLSYLFPLAFYAFMGLVMTEINPGFRDDLLPSMTIFAVLTGALLGLPGPLVDEREAGIYRAYRVNGVPAAAVLAMPALTLGLPCPDRGVTGRRHGRAALRRPGHLRAGAHWRLPPCWAPRCSPHSARSSASCRQSSRATVLLAQAIFLPSMLLGGLMVPLEALPERRAGRRPVAADDLAGAAGAGDGLRAGGRRRSRAGGRGARRVRGADLRDRRLLRSTGTGRTRRGGDTRRSRSSPSLPFVVGMLVSLG